MSPDFVRPHRLDVLLDMPSASHDMQQKHAWNADDRSLNVFVKVRTMFIVHYSARLDSLDTYHVQRGYRGVVSDSESGVVLVVVTKLL